MAEVEESVTAALLRSGEEDREGSSSSRVVGNGGPPLFKKRSLRSRSWRAPFNYHWATVEDAFQDDSEMSAGQREYNRKQRELLNSYKDVEKFLQGVESSQSGGNGGALGDDEQSGEHHEGLAISLSNIANIVLLVIKVFASVKSRSLAIVASTLESLLDLLAGIILLFTRWSMTQENKYKYPIGKLRVQPVGIVIFAAIMAALGMQVLITAAEQLMEGDTGHKMSSNELIWLTVVMGIATACKFALFIYCRSFKSEIVHAYSLDHSFDALTNIVGLAAALLANQFYWWIDPVGAMVLAVYTIYEWSRTVLENAASLIGKAAPKEFTEMVTYISIHHHDKIRHIDTVRAYTFGSLYFVEHCLYVWNRTDKVLFGGTPPYNEPYTESNSSWSAGKSSVDIELPEDMYLKDAHEIGEKLQNKLEALPEVERAYVHLDFESTHKPEHPRRPKKIQQD